MKLSLNALRVSASLLGAVLLTAATASAQVIVIDGQFDPTEWSTATVYKFPVNLPGGGTTIGYLYATNDISNLYFCVRVKEPAIYAAESVVVSLDANGDRYLTDGDDELVLSINGYCSRQKTFADTFRYSGMPPCPAGMLCSGIDTDFGGTNDGNGAIDNDGTWTTYEMWHPRASADYQHDVQWARRNEVGIATSVTLIDASNTGANTGYPSFVTFVTYVLH
jgi:hypothetical protein